MLTSDEELCTFCWAIRGDERNLYKTVVHDQIHANYLLRTTDNFVVLPEIGSFEPGYLIVAPKAHVLSFGHLEPSFAWELDLLLNDVNRWVTMNFRGCCVMFEHGPVSFSKRGGACTDHAHLHVAPVPGSVDLRSALSRAGKVHHISAWLPAAQEQVVRGVPYLFLRHLDGSMWICDANSVQSQEFRRDLVRQLGLDEIWDWVVFPGSDHILATIRVNELYPLDGDRSG